MVEKKEKIEASTQAYLPISEIKEGVVVMDDKSLRSVIIVSSLNFALKSEDEKNAIVSSYQQFLNSLSFPLQIVASSRKIDLSNYLKTVDEAAAKQTSPFIKLQAEEYRNFLQELLEYSNIMEKRFYVVVPYYPGGIDAVGNLPIPFKKKKESEIKTSFEEDKKLLMQRTEETISGLGTVGLRCVALGTEDLLELYYTAYNPDVSKNQKVGSLDDVDIPIIQAGGGAPIGDTL
jgi:hypothetical protein